MLLANVKLNSSSHPNFTCFERTLTTISPNQRNKQIKPFQEHKLINKAQVETTIQYLPELHQ